MTFGLREREMANSIPIFRERESKWKIPIQLSRTGTVIKIPFPFLGTGMGVENSIPAFREREWEAGIPENGREREFRLTLTSLHTPDSQTKYLLSMVSV